MELQLLCSLALPSPPADLEHLFQRALPDPAHGHLLHVHGLHLQRLLLQIIQLLWLFLAYHPHVQK